MKSLQRVRGRNGSLELSRTASQLLTVPFPPPCLPPSVIPRFPFDGTALAQLLKARQSSMRIPRSLSVLLFLILTVVVEAEPQAPQSNRQGATIYVSKLGDNSDGRSWSTAFTTIEAGLAAVPDASGGHRILVRPDTYMESMLSPKFMGAAGAYNELVGDVDGRFGSGTKGDVVLDSSDPKMGFKSYDWYGPFRSNQEGWSEAHTDPTFSAIIWDRWILRNLYVTGGDAGLFWDMTNQIKPFTIIVEDCVGIGRAFGGGVASCLSRPEEPITFRRCHLWALDWWGDTAGAYVRVENESIPDQPDILFEECVMASPQCALKGGNFGFKTFMRIKLDRCRLVALNFSQPQGTPIDGAIQSVEHGKYVHVDLEDTTVMGYKVFGVRVNKETANEIGYTTTGDVKAYVQFQQEVPKGFHRITQWPIDVFSSIAPPSPKRTEMLPASSELIRKDLCEISPVIWDNRLVHMECIRPGSGGSIEDYYLIIKDASSGEELSRFAIGHGLACAHVHDGVFYAFASRWENGTWNDVTMFKSSNLKDWTQKIVVEQENESLFNSSVCQGPDGFVIAYESNDPTYPAFTTKFARSNDLESWTKIPEAGFGTNRYTACPCIRYVAPYYYMLYLENRSPRHYYETYVTRSKDLISWELSSANPVIRPAELDDGINASDPDIVEYEGKTWLYYSVGDQLTWMNIKRKVLPMSEKEFFEQFYSRPGVRDQGTFAGDTAKGEADARAKRFNDAKFGIFIHWGLYALHGKNDKGAYVSWAMEQEGIPVPEYEKYADQFNPTKFDAAEWMKLFKETGARYVTFTSKHHEGFCLFDSALTDYDSVDAAAKRDIVGELFEAARGAGLDLSLYYSLLDWHDPDFKNDLPRYIDEYMFPQIRELCTKYGPIGGIWFDGEWDFPAATWRASDLVGMIRDLQPAALVNDRVGKGERGFTALSDFYTREQPVEIDVAADFEKGRIPPWEACMTMGEAWGFKRGDTNLLSGPEIIRTLVDVAGRGGNFLLNVGPTPEGEIPPYQAERLVEIGKWMEKNGESIYGTEGFTTRAGLGVPATRKGSRLYLHFPNPPSAEVNLSHLGVKILKAWFLEDGTEVSFDPESNTVRVPAQLPNPVVTTVVVELGGEVEPVYTGESAR